jgi:hypothetical protein
VPKKNALKVLNGIVFDARKNKRDRFPPAVKHSRTNAPECDILLLHHRNIKIAKKRARKG